MDEARVVRSAPGRPSCALCVRWWRRAAFLALECDSSCFLAEDLAPFLRADIQQLLLYCWKISREINS